MEVEVTSFLGSLTANLKKFDIDAHSQTLLTAGGDWIEIFQKQLSAGYWIEASLDRQLSILYVLNAFLKEAFRKRDDVDVWLTTIDMMLSNLHIKDSFHEKEVKHVLKLVTIWGNKEKEPKGKAQSSKRRLSIFPTEHCEKWLAAITERALKCGIRLNSTTNEAEVINTDQIPLSRPGVEVNATTKSIQSSSSVSKFPTTSATSKHPAYTTSALSVPIIPALPTLSTSSTSLPYTDDTNHKFIQVVCKFQMQVFQSFACHATRRLDRWNMNIVMLSSFHLLHLYFQEYGATGASPAPLVVACIYLSGKSEYLFVKADKLRQVANKYVRDLNDPIMESNLQVYKYEAQLLRMLQYNVGSIPNPLRVLKALDIIEANSQSPPGVPASLDPITPSNATTSSNNVSSAVSDNTATATTTADTLNVAITATLGTTDATSSTAAASVPSQPPIVVSLKNTGLSQARRLIDEAASVFVKEEYLFNLNTHDLILSEQDFYLASAALLEKIHVAFSDVDLQECERKSSKFLHQLTELSPSLRQNQVLTASTSGYNAKSGPASAPSRFMSLLFSLRLPKEPKPPADLSQMEEGEVLTSDTNSSEPLLDNSSSSAFSESTVRHGTALFSISTGCIELVNRVLPRVEREIYEASAMKARAGTAVPSVPPMPIAPMLAGPVQTLLSRQTAPAYPVHPSRSGLIASGQTSSSSAGINGGARDTYSASQDNRGEKRSRGRSRSPPREENKKRRWDTYAEPDREVSRNSQGDHRGDSREPRDQGGRPGRDREDSRERRRRAEIEAQAVEDAFLMDYDSSKRSRKEQSPHQDRSKSRGHGHQRTPPYDHHRDSHQRDALQSRDHRRRDDSRDRARHRRPRSPLVPPPPPRIPPPPPIPAPPSIPDVPRTMPGSSHKRPRSNSRSPNRHRSYAPLPAYPSVQPPPPSRTSYGSREEYQESSRSSRDNKKVSLSAPLSYSRSVHTSKRTVELEDGEEGELMEDGEINSVDADNSNYCQFIGTSTGNNTGASSAEVSSAPTPFLASAPSAPRVGLTQSMSQSWMPNEEEDGNEVVFLSPPAPVVDLTSGSPFVNTSSILPMPNIAKLTQFLAGRSAASNSSATGPDNLLRAPPVLVVPPVLTVPAVPNQTAPVSVPIIPLVPAEPTSAVVPDVVNAVPELVQTSASPIVSDELTNCTSTENTALSAPVPAPLLVEAQSPKSEGSNTSTAAAEVAQTGEGSILGSTSVHFNPSPSVSVSASSIEGNVSCGKPEMKLQFVEGVVQDVSAVPAEAVGDIENEDGEIVETTAAKTLPVTINSATAATAIATSSTTATATVSTITPVSLTTTNSSALTTEPKSRFVTIPKMMPKWQREQQEAATAKDGNAVSKGSDNRAQYKSISINNAGGTKGNRDPVHSKDSKNIDNSGRNKHDRGANRNDNSAFASASSHQSNKHHSNDTGNSDRNVSPSNQNRNNKRTTLSEHKNTANLAPNDARHIILHSQAAHASRAGSDTTNNHRNSSNTHTLKGHRNNNTGTDTGSSTSSSSGSNGKNSNPEDKKARTFGFIRSILANPEGSRIRK